MCLCQNARWNVSSFWKIRHSDATSESASRVIGEEFFGDFCISSFVCETFFQVGVPRREFWRRLSDKFWHSMQLIHWHKQSIPFSVFYLDIFSLRPRKRISDYPTKYTHAMKEMHHRIAHFYLYEEIELRSLFPTKDSTKQRTQEFIGDDADIRSFWRSCHDAGVTEDLFFINPLLSFCFSLPSRRGSPPFNTKLGPPSFQVWICASILLSAQNFSTTGVCLVRIRIFFCVFKMSLAPQVTQPSHTTDQHQDAIYQQSDWSQSASTHDESSQNQVRNRDQEPGIVVVLVHELKLLYAETL